MIYAIVRERGLGRGAGEGEATMEFTYGQALREAQGIDRRFYIPIGAFLIGGQEEESRNAFLGNSTVALRCALR